MRHYCSPKAAVAREHGNETVILSGYDLSGPITVEMTPEELSEHCTASLTNPDYPEWQNDRSYFWRKKDG